MRADLCKTAALIFSRPQGLAHTYTCLKFMVLYRDQLALSSRWHPRPYCTRSDTLHAELTPSQTKPSTVCIFSLLE